MAQENLIPSESGHHIKEVYTYEWTDEDNALPDIELLCALADFFETSVDNLLGRNQQTLYQNYCLDQRDENRIRTAEYLLHCCLLAGKQGLLSLEEYLNQQKDACCAFPAFCARFLIDGFLRQAKPEELMPFLERYAEGEKDPVTAKMTVTVLLMIFDGKGIPLVRETLHSFLGMQYYNTMLLTGDEQADAEYAAEKKVDLMTRDEKLKYYCERRPAGEDTHILDVLKDCSDKNIQLLLKCMETAALECAVFGVSDEIWRKFFQNLSGRMFQPIHEDMMHAEYTEDQIRDAQKKILDDAVRLGIL